MGLANSSAKTNLDAYLGIGLASNKAIHGGGAAGKKRSKPTIRKMTHLKGYANSEISRNRRSLVGKHVRPLAAVLRIDISKVSDDDLLRQVMVSFPHPQINKKSFKDSTARSIVEKILDTVLSSHPVGYVRGGDEDTCELVAEAGKVSAEAVGGLEGELSRIKSEVVRRIKNLKIARDMIKLAADRLYERGISIPLEDTAYKAQLEYGYNVFQQILKLFDEQLAGLEKIHDVTIMPTTEEIDSYLRDHKLTFDKIGSIKKGDLLTGNVGAYLLHGMAAPSIIAYVVDKALRDVDMKLDEYKIQRDPTEFYNKLAEIVQSHADKFSKEDSLKIIRAIDFLRSSYPVKNKIADIVGQNTVGRADNVEGAAEHRKTGGINLEKRLKHNKEIRRGVLKAFATRLQAIFTDLLKAHELVIKKLRTEIKVGDKMKRYVDAFSALDDITQRGVIYQLTAYSKTAASKQKRERYISQIDAIVAALDDMKDEAPIFADIKKLFLEFRKSIVDFSAIFEKGVGVIGGDERAEVQGASEFEIPELSKYGYSLEQSKRDLAYFYRTAAIRENLKATHSELQEYKKDYPRVVGDAMAELIENEEKACKDEIESMKRANVDERIQRYRRKIGKCKINFYKTIEALDMYLQLHTEKIAGDFDKLAEIQKMLENVRTIDDWFTKNTGNEITKLFEMFPGYFINDKPVYSGLSQHATTVHYYKRVIDLLKYYIDADGRPRQPNESTAGVPAAPGTTVGVLADVSLPAVAIPTTQDGLLEISKLPGNPFNSVSIEDGAKVIEQLKKIMNSFLGLKNIISMVFRLGERDNAVVDIPMEPVQVYNNLVKYIIMSAVSFGLSGTGVPGYVSTGVPSVHPNAFGGHPAFRNPGSTVTGGDPVGDIYVGTIGNVDGRGSVASKAAIERVRAAAPGLSGDLQTLTHANKFIPFNLSAHVTKLVGDHNCVKSFAANYAEFQKQCTEVMRFISHIVRELTLRLNKSLGMRGVAREIREEIAESFLRHAQHNTYVHHFTTTHPEIRDVARDVERELGPGLSSLLTDQGKKEVFTICLIIAVLVGAGDLEYMVRTYSTNSIFATDVDDNAQKMAAAIEQLGKLGDPSIDVSAIVQASTERASIIPSITAKLSQGDLERAIVNNLSMLTHTDPTTVGLLDIVGVVLGYALRKHPQLQSLRGATNLDLLNAFSQTVICDDGAHVSLLIGSGLLKNVPSGGVTDIINHLKNRYFIESLYSNDNDEYQAIATELVGADAVAPTGEPMKDVSTMANKVVAILGKSIPSQPVTGIVGELSIQSISQLLYMPESRLMELRAIGLEILERSIKHMYTEYVLSENCAGPAAFARKAKEDFPALDKLVTLAVAGHGNKFDVAVEVHRKFLDLINGGDRRLSEYVRSYSEHLPANYDEFRRMIPHLICETLCGVPSIIQRRDDPGVYDSFGFISEVREQIDESVADFNAKLRKLRMVMPWRNYVNIGDQIPIYTKLGSSDDASMITFVNVLRRIHKRRNMHARDLALHIIRDPVSGTLSRNDMTAMQGRINEYFSGSPSGLAKKCMYPGRKAEVERVVREIFDDVANDGEFVKRFAESFNELNMDIIEDAIVEPRFKNQMHYRDVDRKMREPTGEDAGDGMTSEKTGLSGVVAADDSVTDNTAVRHACEAGRVGRSYAIVLNPVVVRRQIKARKTKIDRIRRALQSGSDLDKALTAFDAHARGTLSLGNKDLQKKLLSDVAMRGVSAISVYHNLFEKEDMMFSLTMRALCGKIMTILTTYSLFNKPLTSQAPPRRYPPARMILGGDDVAVKIIPEALELYLRLPLLAEYYRHIFDFEAVTSTEGMTADERKAAMKSAKYYTQKITLVPDMVGHFTGIINVIFNKAKDVEEGLYSIIDIQEIIEEINKIYNAYREHASPVKDAILDFVKEVNRRYGILTTEQRTKFLRERMRIYREANGVTDEQLNDYEILPGGEYSSDLYKAMPSDMYVKHDYESYVRKRKFHVDLQGDMAEITAFRKRIDDEFDYAEGHMHADKDREVIDFSRIIRAKQSDLKEAKTDQEKLQIVASVINGFSVFADTGVDRSMLAFHELVAAPLNALMYTYSQTKQILTLIATIADLLTGRLIKKLDKTGWFNGSFGQAAINRSVFDVFEDLAGDVLRRDRAGNRDSFAAYDLFTTGNIDDKDVNDAYAYSVVYGSKLLQTFMDALFRLQAEGLVDVRISDGSIFVDYSRFRSTIEQHLTNVKNMLAKFRTTVPQEIISLYETKVDNMSSLAFLEENLYNQLIKGMPSPTADSYAMLEQMGPAEYARHMRSHMSFGKLNQYLKEILDWLRAEHALPALPKERPNATDPAEPGFDGARTRRLKDYKAKMNFNREMREFVYFLSMPKESQKIIDLPYHMLFTHVKNGVFETEIGARASKYRGGPVPSVENPVDPDIALAVERTYPARGADGGLVDVAYRSLVDSYLTFEETMGSIVVHFNDLVRQYVSTFFDNTLHKVYTPLLSEFANSTFSDAIMPTSNDSSLVLDLVGSVDANTAYRDYYRNIHALPPPQLADTRDVLFSSVGIAIRRIFTAVGKNNTPVFLENSLADVPTYMKENFKANLPLFSRLFRHLIRKCEIVRGMLGVGLDLTQHECLLQTDRATANAVHRRFTDGSAGPAYGQDLITHLMSEPAVDERGTEVYRAVDPYSQTTNINKRVGKISCAHEAMSDHDVKAKLLHMLDRVVAGCTTLIKTADKVLSELDDQPKYLEVASGSVKDYQSIHGNPPLCPISSMLTYLHPGHLVLGDYSEDDRSIEMMVEQASPQVMGTPQFKMLFGTRKVLASNKSVAVDDFAISNIVEPHNEAIPEVHRIKDNELKDLLNTYVALSRYVVDNVTHKEHIAWFKAHKLGGVLSMRRTIRNLNVPKYERLPGGGLNRDMSPDTLRSLTYALINTIADVVRLTESSDVVVSKRALISVLSRRDKDDRRKARIYNVIDMNIVPINVHALQREIPLANTYNYAYTFDEIVSDLFRNLPDNRNSKLYIKLLRDPYAPVSDQEFYYELKNILRGFTSTDLSSPRFFGAEVYNNSLFGNLYDLPPDGSREEYLPGNMLTNMVFNDRERQGLARINEVLRAPVGHKVDIKAGTTLVSSTIRSNTDRVIAVLRILATQFTRANAVRIALNNLGNISLDIRAQFSNTGVPRNAARGAAALNPFDGANGIQFRSTPAVNPADVSGVPVPSPMSGVSDETIRLILREFNLGNTRSFGEQNFTFNENGSIQTFSLSVPVATYLHNIGKMRFDTVFARNIFFIVNLQRIINYKIRLDMAQHRDKVISNIQAIEAPVTEESLMRQ